MKVKGLRGWILYASICDNNIESGTCSKGKISDKRVIKNLE